MFKQGCFPSQAPDFGGMRSFQWLCLWLLLSLHSDEPVSTDLTQMRPWESREARAEHDWSVMPTFARASLHNPAGPVRHWVARLLEEAFGRGRWENHLLDLYSHSSVHVPWLDQSVRQRLAVGHRLGWVPLSCTFLGMLETLSGGLKRPPHEGLTWLRVGLLMSCLCESTGVLHRGEADADFSNTISKTVANSSAS